MSTATAPWILVTGARGFLGQASAGELSGAGHRVRGLGHGRIDPSEQIETGLASWNEAPVSFESLHSLFVECGAPAAVVHAAGGSSVQRAYETPHLDFQRTVVAVADLVEALRRLAPNAHLILASSAAVYGLQDGGRIAETTTPAPISYYGTHKRIAEEVCLTAARHWGLRLSIVRFFSIYGAGLRKQIFWDLFGKFAHEPEEVVLGGTGAETRDYFHVSDAARLLRHLVETRSPEVGEPLVINGGTGKATTTSMAAAALAAACGTRSHLRFSGVRRPEDPTHLVADPAGLAATGFVPKVQLSEGLASYVKWCESAVPPPVRSN